MFNGPLDRPDHTPDRFAVHIRRGQLVIATPKDQPPAAEENWRGVLGEFLQLANSDDDAAFVRFARRHGPLTSDNRQIAKLNVWEQASELTRAAGPLDDYLEPLEGWKSLAAELDFLVLKNSQFRLREALPKGDAAMVDYIAQEQKKWDESRGRLLQPTPPRVGGFAPRVGLPYPVDLGEQYLLPWMQAESNDLVLDGRRATPEIDRNAILSVEHELFSSHFDRLLQVANLMPRLVWSPQTRQPFLVSRGWGLFASIVQQLVDDMVDGSDYYLCGSCERIFLFRSTGLKEQKRRRPRARNLARCEECKSFGDSRAYTRKLWREKHK